MIWWNIIFVIDVMLDVNKVEAAHGKIIYGSLTSHKNIWYSS